MNKKPDSSFEKTGGQTNAPSHKKNGQDDGSAKARSAEKNIVSSGGDQFSARDPSQSQPRQDTAHKKNNTRNNNQAHYKPKVRWYNTYAALDLGTNNCRLLVARPTRRSFLVVDAFSRIIRLGEGVGSTGVLSTQAMDRTIDALKICSLKMQRKGVTKSRLIATEACRIAKNSDEFIMRVQREAGLNLEIINQETEASLAVTGCASLLDNNCDWALVFDIGGGSSELIWLDLNVDKAKQSNQTAKQAAKHKPRKIHKDQIKCWTSLPIGVVTLSEKFGGKDVTRAQFEAMIDYVTSYLAEFERDENIAAFLKKGVAHLLGTSGTVTTLAGIYLELPCYDRKQVDGCWLKSSDILKVSQDLVNMTYEERVAVPCIGVDRADLVLAGCAILEALMRMWPCENLRVADRGLREGILTTLMTDDGVYRQRRRKRR